MKWSDKVSTLEIRVAELRNKLNSAQAALHEAKMAECGVKIGDIVRNDAVVLRVTKVYPDSGSVSGNPLKKDGTFGMAVRNLYEDWKHCNPDGSPKEPAP
jgi:hypothetical protein